MAEFGMQCDAITKKGDRCRCKNSTEIPTMAQQLPTGDRQQFAPVRLCSRHYNQYDKIRQAGNRMQLRDGGWLGPYNQYKYGNVVVSIPVIDWTRCKNLTVPKAWR